MRLLLSMQTQCSTEKLLLAMKQMNVFRCSVLAASLLFSCACVLNLATSSACAAEEAQKQEVLTNASVIELQKMDLGDGVILDKIKTSKCDFDVSLEGLKQLKDAKVSSAVIQAMITAKAPAKPAVVAAEAKPLATGDQNDPQVVHEAGVWLYEEADGKKKMTQLEGESFRIWSGMSGPFGAATRAVLTGLSAKVKVTARKPVFYMYFGDSTQGILGSASPSQLPLAKLDVKPKTQERLLVIGSAAAYAGYNSGINKKALRGINSEKVAAGIYKVTPQEDLADGEYSFCFYGSEVQVGTAGKMFCFGVQQK